MALFDFELSPLAEVRTWGRPGAERLHWYALSEGRFRIDIGGAAVWPEGCAFYVAQFWESLLDVMRERAGGEPVRLDLRFLHEPPEIWFWEVQGIVRVRWEDRVTELPAAAFEAEFAAFHARFFTEMAGRGVAPEGVGFDPAAFLEENVRRRGWWGGGARSAAGMS